LTRAGHVAERSCVACRTARPQGELLRYVLAPDGRLLVDYQKKLPGRGAYTCFDPACIALAGKRGQFARAFRRPVEMPGSEELLADLARQIRQRLLALIALARKAGQVVSGSNLVLSALGSIEPPAIVLIAGDTSAGIAEKVAGKARSLGVPNWTVFDKDAFGQVLGKEERSVVAVKEHPLAGMLIEELTRYSRIAGEC
jgi:predicted RNA-binding protein YlxR (DUF448 family)